MRLLLARHGESTWNAEGRYQGRLDAPLSSRGRAQVEALAARLVREQASQPPERRLVSIVSSPLPRALDTARICGDALRLEVQVDERLTEISHGEWEGKLRGEVAIKWPEMLARWRTSPHLVQFPGGEMLEEVELRFRSFVHDLRLSKGPTFAATHDVIVRIAVLRALGKELSAFNDVHVDNAALNEFLVEGSNLEIVRRNDATHLGSLRSDNRTQAL